VIDAAGAVGRTEALGDDALTAERAGVPEDDRAVAVEVLVEGDAVIRAVEEIGQQAGREIAAIAGEQPHLGSGSWRRLESVQKSSELKASADAPGGHRDCNVGDRRKLHELKFAPNEDVWCQRPIKSGANRITQSSALVCPAPLVKSKVFAFTISFHIIYPSFTIGLAAWLTILEALHLATGRPAYRVVFDFWLKIFGVTFGMGVVSGIVMAFQFGTNWEVLARMTGPIQGVLLTYETFTAFFLEASFFGILLFGRPRVPPWFYLFSTAMVALGTTLSAFWIMANNSWMQAPTGYVVENGAFVPTDWAKIVFSPVLWVRFPHMLLASFITGAFCVAATGAWYLLRGKFAVEAYVMLRMGLFLAAILVPVQIFFGHLNGDYIHDYQPAKFAAIEARWHDEQPAGEVLIAIPDEQTQTNYFEIKVPVLGSLIASMSLACLSRSLVPPATTSARFSGRRFLANFAVHPVVVAASSSAAKRRRSGRFVDGKLDKRTLRGTPRTRLRACVKECRH
jgi:hypothetical protein